MIRAVFFDVGGTLIHPWPSVGDVYARMGREYGFHSTPAAMEQAFRAAWKAAKSGAPRKLTTGDKEWWRTLVFQALAIQGLTGTNETRNAYFEALYQAFVQPEAWRIYPDVIPTLGLLRSRKIHLGIISNWDQRLRPLLAGLGLTGYFDTITVSCEVGAEKPDAAIFQAALGSASVEAVEAIHVGDSAGEDGQGAAAVGMHFLQVRQTEKAIASGLAQVLEYLATV